ncbi:MAG: hypothetical protein AAGA54_07075 [Myxococcota bacterium]
MEGFFDDFEDGVIDPGWDAYDSGDPPHAMSESGGDLRWSFDAGEVGFLGVRHPFEGTLDRVRVHATDIPSDPAGHSQLVLFVQGLDDPLYVVWMADGAQLRYGPTNLPLDQSAYVELRLEPGLATALTSPDGVTFSSSATVDIAGPLDELAVVIYGQTWTSGGADMGALGSVEACRAP